MDPSLPSVLPPMKDMNTDNITKNTILINSQGHDKRLQYLMERMVTHVHDFARETRLSTKEWKAGLDFLVQIGQISTDVRHEFILLSDVLGLSLLVDAIDHPKPSNSTEGSVLGPFHTQEAEHIDNGYKMSSDPNGEPCLVICSISDTAGTPISGVEVDIWETDSSGHYDVQYATPHGPDGRCVMTSDAQGHFWFRAIKPVSYPIPHDGPVGALLKLLHRHPWRPAHMHFMFEKEGWDHLITALYIATDPYLLSDAVFGVKDSLIVSMKDASEVLSPAEIKFYSIEPEMQVLKHNFVLVTRKETEYLRNKNAIKEMDNVFPGKKIRFLDSLPVPDLD